MNVPAPELRQESIATGVGPSSGRAVRHRIAALAAWAICSALYLWTANGVAVRDSEPGHEWHQYEYLVDGFLKGQLSLSLKPPQSLLALPDPYDPATNRKYRLWDASLYHGKYYLYYGPSPALLLMLPWKVITGRPLPQRMAAGIFAVLGLGALTLLLVDVQRRHFGRLPATGLFFTILLAGHFTWLPVILRRPAFWELPIITAAALFWWSLYFTWRSLHSARPAAWGAAAGAALAFTLGARPTYVFAAGIVAVLPLLPGGSDVPRGRRPGWFASISIPLLAGGTALLVYNYLRFGSILEFGQSFQLWGFDERHVRHFSFSYIPFNAWVYLLALPNVGVYFPFLHATWIANQPAGYIATEEMCGILAPMPVILAGLLPPIRGWARRGAKLARTPLGLLTTVAAGGSLFAAAVLFCFAGACSRYIVELMSGWSVVTGIGLLLAFDRSGGRFRGRVLRPLAFASGLWSIACVWFVSYDFRQFAPITQPTVYPALARVMDYPSFWAAELGGRHFGPVLLRVRLAGHPATGSTVLLGAGSESMVDRLLLERISPSEFRLRLTVNSLIMLETPILHASGDTILLQCAAPWLYPPNASPFWDTIADPRKRRIEQTLYRITVNGVAYSVRSEWAFDSARFDPAVRKATPASGSCAWVEQWWRIVSNR